jgi:hypothetical protein
VNIKCGYHVYIYCQRVNAYFDTNQTWEIYREIYIRDKRVDRKLDLTWGYNGYIYILHINAYNIHGVYII